MGLWLVTSILFMATWLGATRAESNRADIFVLLWIAGFFGMMALVMDWVAARYYLIVLPAVGVATVRLIEKRWPDRTLSIVHGILGALILFSIALAYADYNQAEPSRHIGSQLRQMGYEGGPRHFFLGDSFTMSYVRRDGWIPCFPETELKVGDLILAKEVTMPQHWLARRHVRLQRRAVFSYPTNWPLKVMDYQGSAGFYASLWGALPWTISTGPWETFDLFEVAEIY
jgi:hypothetical protein